MNETAVLMDTAIPEPLEERDYEEQSRPACNYVPASVNYIVTRVLEKRTLSASDMASLREIALHFHPGGSLNDFLKLYLEERAKLQLLLREAEILVASRRHADAHQVLTDCMFLLHEWEFLRFEEPIRTLDDLLFLIKYETYKVSGWRNAMTGFDFSETDARRNKALEKKKKKQRITA